VPFRYALAERGKLVSGVEAEPYQTVWGQSLIPMESLGGVVAPLEARRRGKTQVLLRHVLGAMRERGTPLSTITTPFSYPFYRRVGFEYAFQRRRYTFPPELLLQLTDVPGSLRHYPVSRHQPTLPYQLAILYELALGPAFQSYARRTPAQWASHLAGRNTDVYVWDGPAGPCAYAIISITPQHITIHELLATTDLGLKGLLKALGSLDSQTHELVWDAVPTYHLDRWVAEPDRIKIQLTPEGTFRLVDVKSAIEQRRFHWKGTGHIALAIADNVCEWNAGTWTFSFEQGQATVLPEIMSEHDVGFLDVRTLGLIYAGAISAQEAVRYYDARLSPQQQQLLNGIFLDRQPLLLESF
jgi:predicted acetyltransferase